MPKQFGKGLSFGYAVGIPRHRRSLRSLVLVWGLDFSFSGMDMAQISGAFWKGGNCTELTRMLAPQVNNSQPGFTMELEKVSGIGQIRFRINTFVLMG